MKISLKRVFTALIALTAAANLALPVMAQESVNVNVGGAGQDDAPSSVNVGGSADPEVKADVLVSVDVGGSEEPKADSEVLVSVDAGGSAETEANEDAPVSVNIGGKSEAEEKTEAKVETGGKYEAKAEEKTAAKTEEKSEAKTEEKTEAKSEAKPESKSDDDKKDESAESEAAAEAEVAKGRVIFMLYHDIAPGDTLRETDTPAWCTTEARLKENIETLYSLGFEPLSCAMYYDGNYDKDKNYFVLTFDDGYLSNYTILPQVLEETNAYADIFMCTEMTLLDNHFKYSDAKAMEEGGRVKCYSHFNKHEYINELTKGELKRELKLSFSYLDKRIGGERDMFFAYPHSSYSESTIKMLKEFGVTLQFVQFLPPESYGIDWREYGIVLRATVGYDSDIAALVDEYFAVLDNR